MRKTYLGILLVDIIFIAVSLFMIFSPDKHSYNTTTGKIVEIREEWDVINDCNSYTPFIDYEVNGKEYKHIEYGSYSYSMKVNDEVIVYYDVDDPTFIQAQGYKKVPYVVLGIAVIYTLITVFLLLRRH